MRHHLKQFLKFATVGLLNTAIDFGLLNYLILLGWGVIPANTLAFLVASTNSFFWNKYWTFQDTKKAWHSQIVIYILTVAVGVGISDLVIYWCAIRFGWDINVSKVLSIAATVSWNFLVPKLFIFKK